MKERPPFSLFVCLSLACVDLLILPISAMRDFTLSVGDLFRIRSLKKKYFDCGQNLDLFRHLEYSYVMKNLNVKPGEDWFQGKGGQVAAVEFQVHES